MEENRKKYILLNDRVGDKIERGLFNSSATPIQVLRGEILEALPEAEQPSNPHRVALVGVERKSLRVECPTSELARLTDEETELLLAVTSAGERHQIYHERNRLDAGRRLKESSKVLVKVKGVSKDVPGVVWYKGPIDTSSGTMFGVELTDHTTYGTTDGIFRNKRYFRCPPDSGVFVSLDKLTVLEDAESKTSPKKTEDSKGKLAVWKDKLIEHVQGASGSKTDAAERKGQKEVDHIKCPLKIDQKVIVFLENNKTVRGSVRHVGGAKDKQGRWYVLAGVELEERCGDGTGIFQDKQLFVCKSGFAKFVPVDSVIPVEELDNMTGKREKVRTEDDIHYNTRYQDKLRKEAAGNHRDKTPKSMSYIDANRPRASAPRSSQSFRRTSSSSSTDDMEIMRSADLGMKSDGSNREKILEDQRRILDEIQKNQWEKIDKKDVAELSSFHEDHYSGSGGHPITVQPGLSKFYSDNRAGLDRELRTGGLHTKNEKEGRVLGGEKSRCLARGTTSSSSPPGLSNGLTVRRCSDKVTLVKKTPQTNIYRDAIADCANTSETATKDLCVVRNNVNHPLDESSPNVSPPPVSDNSAIQPFGAQNSKTEDVAVGQDVAHRFGLEVGSMVEIPLVDGQQPRYGVIRWIGYLSKVQGKLVAGVELEERNGSGTGIFQGTQLFVCKSGFAMFLPADSVIPVEKLENMTGKREKVRTEDDIPYNTRYQDKLRKEAAGNHRDKTPRSMSYIDANRPRAKASTSSQSFRRASSSTSTDDIEIIRIADLGMNSDGSNKDLVVQDQRRIPDEIKQCEKNDTKYVKPRIAELMNVFEDHHYSSGGRPINDQAAGLPQEKVDKYELQEAQFASPSDHLIPVPVLTMEPGLVSNTKERQLEERRTELNGVTNTKKRQLGELRTELNDVINMKKRQLEELRTELNDVTSENEILIELINTKDMQLGELRTELNVVTNVKEGQLEELEMELTVVTNTKERQLEEMRKELNEVTNTKERQLEEIRTELSDVTSTKERQIEGLRTELEEMSSANERLERSFQQERENLQRERDELRNRVESLAVDWTVNREEIHLTNTDLGKGGWATVKVGVFRGMKVAVKQIHELILSDYNRNLFAREMQMASRCRHPCFLQFIGATNDDGQSPLLLTEILDTSLRKVLSDRSLGVEEVLPIALDVGKALNYLHLNQPEAIIHRDISSANVLLWQKGNCWRAKVSDYGTANFMRQCGTVNPGAPLYVAPEALDVARQSPKMDVYSFGLLLCEMCIRELPDPRRRLEQIVRVQHAELRDLVTRCVRREPRDRPDMAAVLRELEALEQRR